MADYWRSLDPDTDPANPTSADPMDWPDGPQRRLALGHQDERDVPGYCTCGELVGKCPVRPRTWRSAFR
jgi:hypothetical protein